MVTGLSPVEPAPAMPASPRSPVSPHAPATALDIPAVQPVPAQAHHAASLPSARVLGAAYPGTIGSEYDVIVTPRPVRTSGRPKTHSAGTPGHSDQESTT